MRINLKETLSDDPVLKVYDASYVIKVRALFQGMQSLRYVSGMYTYFEG